MKLEEQVLSLEQIEHLKEIGFEIKDTAMAWFPPYKYDDEGLEHFLFGEKKSYTLTFNDGYNNAIPTLTLQEIMDILPESIGKCTLYTSFHHSGHCPSMMWYAQDYYMNNGETLRYFEVGNPLQTAYNMLCWVIENGYLKQ